MWRVTVIYDDGGSHTELLADEAAMIEFQSNLETDSVVTIDYSRYV